MHAIDSHDSNNHGGDSGAVAPAQEVLDFWFLPADHPEHGKSRAAWWKKNDAFDAVIRSRFGATVQAALAGGLREWDDFGPRGTLARILVLDQFTRNGWRGTPGAFAGDALALQAATELVDSGAHLSLSPMERWFAYMPFEHAEEMAMQERAVALFSALAEDAPGLDDALDYARRHLDVIARFGRFPHRNAILGRVSTAEEAAYLAQPGSGF